MWIMPQIAMMQIISKGIKEMKANPAMLEEVFGYMKLEGISDTYGDKYVEQIKAWFTGVKIPVVHAWGISADRIPCVSIHLSSESEDESKAALNDYWGEDENTTIGHAVFTVNLDIGIFASKTGDQVLWLYYIVSYILFMYKKDIESLGLHLQTYSTSDWDRRNEYNIENIWTRWIKFKCTTSNQWTRELKSTYDVRSEVEVESMFDIDEEE